MIQRYGTVYSAEYGRIIDKKADGEYYKSSDIDHLIEWRELSLDDRPKDEVEVRISVETMPYTEFHGHLETRKNKVNYVESSGEGVYDVDDIFNKSCNERFKWQHLPPDPWSNK